MLWNVVYDFFVKYIFGGYTEDSVQYAGYLGTYRGGSLYFTSTFNVNIFGNDICIGNYLSLIATIISMVVIVVLACLFIKKIYNMCAHIIA